jgi:hypothetical protein
MPGAPADFDATFHALRRILTPYEPRLILRRDAPDGYYLDTPFSEKWKRELFFGAVQVKKRYVSFHLMPVYMFPDLLVGISDGLRQRMQGKSCFNFKRPDPELVGELEELAARAVARLEAESVLAPATAG